MSKLCVNVDHVATVRQARRSDYPDPLEAALIAEKAGAVGITVHLREDRRHIQDHDVYRIKKSITTKLNLEMAANDEIIEIAHDVKPYQVTFVPERRREITTEGGLDATKRQKRLRGIIEEFRIDKILVSLFIDPEEEQIKAAVDVGANAIEINTGAYSEAKTNAESRTRLKKIMSATKLSAKLGVVTHAGHGLHLANTAPIASIANVEELNIGHSIIGRAMMVGMDEAVREMIRVVEGR